METTARDAFGNNLSSSYWSEVFSTLVVQVGVEEYGVTDNNEHVFVTQFAVTVAGEYDVSVRFSGSLLNTLFAFVKPGMSLNLFWYLLRVFDY